MFAKEVLAKEDAKTYVTLFHGITVTLYKTHFALCLIEASNSRNFAGETRNIEKAILRQQWDILVLQLWMIYCDTGNDACSLNKLITLLSTKTKSVEYKTKLQNELQQIGWKNGKKRDSLKVIQSFRTNGIAHMLNKKIPDYSVNYEEVKYLFELAVKCYEIITPPNELYGAKAKEHVFSLSEQAIMNVFLQEFFDYLSLSCVYASEINCVIEDDGADDIGKELMKTVERINRRKVGQRAQYHQ